MHVIIDLQYAKKQTVPILNICRNKYTGSLQSMATVKYLVNGFSEILDIWYIVKSI
jgi:hypothetical protein